MAKRFVYVPLIKGKIGVHTKEIEFTWFPGLSKLQKQKSIEALHKEINNIGITPVLEISSKSKDILGVSLSAFNLFFKPLEFKDIEKKISVESAFQGSKVFQQGGPYEDLIFQNSRDAKKDNRLKESGQLIKFIFFSREFPLNPKTFFYDWLYINALYQNKSLAEQVLKYSGFTDIEFNPEKSINCQAFSAALFVSLVFSNVLNKVLESPETFLKTLSGFYDDFYKNTRIQGQLF